MKKHIKTALLLSLFVFFIVPQLAQAQGILQTITGAANCVLAANQCRTDFNSCQARITNVATGCGERKDRKLQSCDRTLQRADSRVALCQTKHTSCVAKAGESRTKCQRFQDNQSRYQGCINSADKRLAKCSSAKTSCDSRAQQNRTKALARKESCVSEANSNYSKCQSDAVSKGARAVVSCTNKLNSCISRVQRRCPGI